MTLKISQWAAIDACYKHPNVWQTSTAMQCGEPMLTATYRNKHEVTGKL